MLALLFVWIGIAYLISPHPVVVAKASQAPKIEHIKSPKQEYIPAKDWWRDWETIKAA